MGKPTQSQRTSAEIVEQAPDQPPPVYTPFGPADDKEVRVPLNENSIPRPVATPMWIRIQKQINKLNWKVKLGICVAFAALVLIIIAFINGFSELESDDTIQQPPPPEKNPLTFNFAEITSHEHYDSKKLSYDAINKQLILSTYDVNFNRLEVKTFKLRKDVNGLIETVEDDISHVIKADERFDECMQYDVASYCCQLNFETRCFHNADGIVVNSTIESAHLPQTYQRVSKNENVLVALNKHTRSFLDMKTNKVKDIEKCCEGTNKKSMGFYFPASSANTVNELVKDGNNYKVCGYQLSHSTDNHYERTQSECIDAGIDYDPESPHVKFCSNPSYIAILVHEHRDNEVKWKLSFKFWEGDQVYTMSRIDSSTDQKMVLSCEAHNIDVYVSTTSKILRYDVKLPPSEDD
uniref:DUF4793 domain-containing protein n=1 Tax=Rhabditophanes sp. KR3021 TaxID=114890 RepID=A0AC35TWD0_9BILA